MQKQHYLAQCPIISKVEMLVLVLVLVLEQVQEQVLALCPHCLRLHNVQFFNSFTN